MANRKLLIGVMLVVIGTGAAYAWNSLPSTRRWQQGYSQILEGDSEEKVIEVLGKPTEINDCHRPSYSGNPEMWQKCAEEYWYVAFMERWIYVIGKDGKVIAKSHSVSP